MSWYDVHIDFFSPCKVKKEKKKFIYANILRSVRAARIKMSLDLKLF